MKTPDELTDLAKREGLKAQTRQLNVELPLVLKWQLDQVAELLQLNIKPFVVDAIQSALEPYLPVLEELYVDILVQHFKTEEDKRNRGKEKP